MSLLIHAILSEVKIYCFVQYNVGWFFCPVYCLCNSLKMYLA